MTVRTLFPTSLASKCRHFHTSIRSFNLIKSDKIKTGPKAYSKTLLLPKTAFPLWTDPLKSQACQRLTCDELYNWQWNNARGPLFVLHDGPPYANGDLHMGHALNKIIKDIINRFHVSLGYKVHYVPGWDCHGLPIENKALQDFGEDALNVPAGIIREAARNTALREIESQKAQFQPLGIMADWDSAESTYRTLDHHYEMRQLRIFKKMVEKGMIYRHYRPVYYSPSSRSALAEAELIYEDDHVSHSVYVTFDVDRSGICNSIVLQGLLASSDPLKLLVWTTTPWTLTANMGIAINPKISYVAVRKTAKTENINEKVILIVAKERLMALGDILGPTEIIADLQGSDIIDLLYKPIFSSLTSSAQTMKIISASHVTSEFGTGLVHCAPAHGAEDYDAFRTLGLLSSSHNMLCHVDREGKFTKDVENIVGETSAGLLIGQEVLGNGSKAIVDLLNDVGNLVKIKRIKHRYPYDWRTKKPVIVTATSQWFANLDKIKDGALTALKEVVFFPDTSRNRLESFIRSRSEWCISRQRAWGVPITALHHIETDRAVLDTTTLNHILNVLQEKGLAHWWNGPIEDFVPSSLHEANKPIAETWRKGNDTMDVWFDSGTSWSMLSEMGVGYTREDGKYFDANICLEGSDQHRGWFQSQLLTKVGATPEDTEPTSPYGTLITHGMVLDEKGKKMSKSIGNILSPMTIVSGGKDLKKEPAYGPDVLRLWAATVDYWRDMSIGPTILSQVAESMRKIRNSARFCLGNIGSGSFSQPIVRVSRDSMGLAEKYAMHELYTLEKTALDGYASYNFPKVINATSNFVNITLSSIYFDITKDCLYANSLNSHERRAVVTVLENILSTMTSIIAPVLPHLAEEIHATWKADGKSVFMNKWKPLGAEWQDLQAEKDMKELLLIRGSVLSFLEHARGNKQIKSSLEAEVDIIVPDGLEDSEIIRLIRRQEGFLKTLFIVSDVQVIDEGSLGTSSPEWLYSGTLPIRDHDGSLAIRVRPATLQKCPRCWTFTRPNNLELCRRCSNVIHEHT